MSSDRKRPPAPRKSYHHGDLRAALLEATQALLDERGSEELSLREVARRAQVSHGAPAHHFRNKAGLLTAFAAQGFERLAATIEAQPEHRRAASGPELLVATGRGYVRFALDNPAHFSIMFDTAGLEPAHPDYAGAADRAYRLLTAAMDRCVTEGRIDKAQARAATVAAWSLAHGFVTLWIGGRLGARSGARSWPKPSSSCSSTAWWGPDPPDAERRRHQKPAARPKPTLRPSAQASGSRGRRAASGSPPGG
jgi:AcrR family transcriptional regulator